MQKKGKLIAQIRVPTDFSTMIPYDPEPKIRFQQNSVEDPGFGESGISKSLETIFLVKNT